MSNTSIDALTSIIRRPLEILTILTVTHICFLKSVFGNKDALWELCNGALIKLQRSSALPTPPSSRAATTNTNSHTGTNTLLDSNALLRQLSWLLVNLASLILFDGLTALPYASYWLSLKAIQILGKQTALYADFFNTLWLELTLTLLSNINLNLIFLWKSSRTFLFLK